MNKPGSISFFVFHRNILHCFRNITPVVQVTKEQVITAGDGKSYKVTVTYDFDAGIPDDAELSVSELDAEGKDYKKYVKEAAKKLEIDAKHFSFAHAFDIALVNPETGEHYQPTKKVSVIVRLLKEDVSEDSDLSVVHFGEKTEVLESSVNGEKVEFETDGFSVYVIIDHEGEEVQEARVEFHFIRGRVSNPTQEQTAEGTVLWYTSGPYSFYNKSNDNNAGKKQVSIIVHDGDRLEPIEAPTPIGDSEFFGWYTVSAREDTTTYNSTNHTFSGEIEYRWPDNDKGQYYLKTVKQLGTNVAMGTDLASPDSVRTRSHHANTPEPVSRFRGVCMMGARPDRIGSASAKYQNHEENDYRSGAVVLPRASAERLGLDAITEATPQLFRIAALTHHPTPHQR